MFFDYLSLQRCNNGIAKVGICPVSFWPRFLIPSKFHSVHNFFPHDATHVSRGAYLVKQNERSGQWESETFHFVMKKHVYNKIYRSRKRLP